MFHFGSWATNRRLSAVERHLIAMENELGHPAAGTSEKGNQLSFAIGSILNGILGQFRHGRHFTANDAASFSNEAIVFGARVGNDALGRIGTEIERRPFVSLAAAIGIGLLLPGSVVSTLHQLNNLGGYGYG